MPAVVLVEANEATLEVSRDGSAFDVIPYLGNITYSGSEAPVQEKETFDGVGQAIGVPRLGTIECQLASYVPELPVFDILEAAFDEKTTLSWKITTKEDPLDREVEGNTAAITTAGVVTFAGEARDFRGEEYGLGLAIGIDAPALFKPSAGSQTAAIATTGVVTFAGTAPGTSVLAVGNIVRVDGEDYTIITAGASPTVDPTPGTAITATDDYSIHGPSAVYRVSAIAAAGAVTVSPAPSVGVLASPYEIVNPSRQLGPFKGKLSSLRNFELPVGDSLSSGLTIVPRAKLPRWVLV